MRSSVSNNPGVKVPPPFLYLLGFIVAWVLETRAKRIHIARENLYSLEIAGVILAAVGLILVGWALITFARAHTGILPIRPATRIVSHGPYSITRNPMYTGLGITFLGAALCLDFGWMIVMLPLVLIAIYVFVIRREEAYLMSAFPEEYGQYRRKVRRWL